MLKNNSKKFLSSILILVFTILMTLSGCTNEITNNSTANQNNNETISSEENTNDSATNNTDDNAIDENGLYTTKEEVAYYLHTYNKLPSNYLTKQEAYDLGWDNSKGNLWDVTDHMSIGGNSFGNREKLLPEENGRKWYECDINYQGGYRNAERIIYSNDGLIYYTDDHYESFTQLY
ncbi:ribonuclease domain-containing protein [Clostridium sp. DL1XJH146]